MKTGPHARYTRTTVIEHLQLRLISDYLLQRKLRKGNDWTGRALMRGSIISYRFALHMLRAQSPPQPVGPKKLAAPPQVV